MVRKIFTLNFLDAFIAGMTTVFVPLLMQSRGIGLAEIGIAFSIAPLVKLAARLGGAFLADFLGDRMLYISNAAANLLQAICYFFATGPIWFAAGKVFDGIRESLIFSVNRVSVMAAMPQSKHFALSSLLSGRLIYNALGGLAVGVLAQLSGFDLMLSLIACLSAYMLLSSLSLRNLHHAGGPLRLSDLSFAGKSNRFYETATVLAIGSWTYVAMVYMLMPLYFSSKGFSVAEIGILYSAYFVISGAVMHLISHIKISSLASAAFGGLAFLFAIIGLAVAEKELLMAFFLLMAIGDGFLGVLWEEINYLAIKDSRKKATELALVNTPAYLSVFAATALAGIIASAYGYMPLFALFAISELAFAAWGFRLSSKGI
ncbi:MAG: MFS transporter [Candidatus Anstonellaceae archaeon]